MAKRTKALDYPGRRTDQPAPEALLKLARALGRQAAREDYERERNDWRKRPRKRVLKPPNK